MEDFYIVLIKFVPIFTLILLGVLIRKAKLIKTDTIQDLKNIIIYFSLPSLLFITFAKTNLEFHYIIIVLAVFTVCVLMLVLGTGFTKRLCPGNKYYPSVFSSYETGMLGFALFSSIFGAENTYKLAIIDIGQELFVFFVLVSFLNKQNGANESIKQLILSFIKSPPVLAIVSGIVLSSTGLTEYLLDFKITDSFVNVLNLLGNLTVPLICIIIGYEFQINVREILRPLLTALVRMVLMIVFAFVINELLIEKLLGLDEGFKTALYTMFLLPPSFIIPIFINQNAKKEKKDILNMISVNIALTLVAFFVLVTVTA